MPTINKVSILINGLSRGWSESWYYETPGDLGTVDTNAILLMAARRMRLCATQWTCDGIRVANVANRRLVTLLESGAKGKAVANTESPDNAVSSWLVRAQTASGSKRQVWLRGLWDEWIRWSDAQQKFPIQASMQEALDAWTVTMVTKAGGATNNWRIQRVLPGTDAATAQLRVASIGTNLLNETELTLTAAPPWNIEGGIIVSGFVKPFAFLNGTYSSGQWSKAGVVVTLNRVSNVLITQSPILKLRVRARIFAYEPIRDFTPVRVGSRRTGRAFFVPAGRR